MSHEDDLLTCRIGIWNQRDTVIDTIMMHEPDCFAREVNEAGIRLVGWSVKNFLTAALLDRPELLGIEA